jgi:hypothetical protein
MTRRAALASGLRLSLTAVSRDGKMAAGRHEGIGAFHANQGMD